MAQTWYDNLTVAGNTSLNPFFYGTYLGVTKPNEPVTRNENQVFQADAVGAMKQLVPEHFKTPHTFRVEWQPGRGGRLDWFTKSYKKVDENGTIYHIEGDGKGQEWEHSLSIPDFALDDAMGSKIPEEPSYIIFNTAISSTWAFPYDVPEWCPKCYDCNDPKCTCSFNPGFCNMMKTGKVALKIDSVRVYQSKDDDAHSGRPHTVGCDPPEFPSTEYIKGYEYRYMRNPPFVNADKHPLRSVKNGGGECMTDMDCGGGGAEDTEVDESWELPDRTKKQSNGKKNKNGTHSSSKQDEDVLDLDKEETGSTFRENSGPLAHTKSKNNNNAPIRPNRRLGADQNNDTSKDTSTKEGDDKETSPEDEGEDPTAGLDKPPISEESIEDNEVDTKVLSKNPHRKPKGRCVTATPGLFGIPTSTGKQCKCNEGYTGPNCLSADKYNEELGAYELKLKQMKTLFTDRSIPYLTRFHVFIGGMLVGTFIVGLVMNSLIRSRRDREAMEMAYLR